LRACLFQQQTRKPLQPRIHKTKVPQTNPPGRIFSRPFQTKACQQNEIGKTIHNPQKAILTQQVHPILPNIDQERQPIPKIGGKSINTKGASSLKYGQKLKIVTLNLGICKRQQLTYIMQQHNIETMAIQESKQVFRSSESNDGCSFFWKAG
jgi:hypothetical protein